MNKFSFNYNDSYYEVNFDKIICFNANCKYVDELSDVLIDGLLGGTKDFLYNNTLIKKKEFEVVDYNGSTIFDDLKLTSKSYNLKLLKSVIYDYENKDQLQSKLAECLQELQIALHKKYDFLIEDYSELILPKFKIDNLDSIFQNLFHLVDKENISDSISVEMQLLLLLHYLADKQNSFLVIRDFKLGLDISQRLYFLDKIMQLDNVYVVLFINDAEFYYYTKNIINHLFIIDSKINSTLSEDIMNSCISNIMYKEFLEHDEYVMILKNLEKEHILINYNKYLSERSSFISYFFEKYNIHSVI